MRFSRYSGSPCSSRGTDPHPFSNDLSPLLNGLDYALNDRRCFKKLNVTKARNCCPCRGMVILLAVYTMMLLMAIDGDIGEDISSSSNSKFNGWF